MNRAWLCGLALLASGCAPLLATHPRSPYHPTGPRWHAPSPPPLPFGRWDEVMSLGAGSEIVVLTADGQARKGGKVLATADTLRIEFGAADEQIRRADVMRIDLIDAAGSELAAVTRTAAGHAVLGAAATGVVAILLGRSDVLPPARLLGAGAAGGAVAGAHAEILRQRQRVIYLSPAFRP